jgi:hypothetical protein
VGAVVDAIFASSGSPATTVAWLELAGDQEDQIARVVELQLYETLTR